MNKVADRQFMPVNIAILTVSDSRTIATDASGNVLAERIAAAGHHLVERKLVADDIDAIVTALRAWVAEPGVDVVITTGGTGVTGRDVTPEAVRVVCDKEIPGFGELFRWLSYAQVSVPRRCRAGRWLLSQTAPTSSRCPDLPAPARMPGTTSWCISWMCGTCPATSSSCCRGSRNTSASPEHRPAQQ